MKIRVITKNSIYVSGSSWIILDKYPLLTLQEWRITESLSEYGGQWDMFDLKIITSSANIILLNF